MLVLSLGIANALNYNVNVHVLPAESGNGVVGDDENFLVFGYVHASNKQLAVPSEDLNIKIFDSDGNIVATYTPNYVDNSNSNFAFDGYFYKELSISGEGSYVVRAEAGDSKDFDYVNVKTISDREVSVKLMDYAINGDQIKFGILVSNNDASAQRVTVALYGKNNFDTPTKFSVNVNSDSEVYVEKTYSLSDFGDGNFIVVAQAYVDGGSDVLYSSPSYLKVYSDNSDITPNRALVKIADVKLPQNTIFPGDILEGKVFIENDGATTAQYRFEYIVDNTVFNKGEIGFVEPGQTAVENFFAEVPNKESMNITFKVYNGYSEDSFTKVVLISQKTKQFFVGVNQMDYVVNGSGNVPVNLNIINTGTLEDSYTVDVLNWSSATVEKNPIKLAPNENETVNVLFNVPDDMRVGDYSATIEVCNTDSLCQDKEITIQVSKPESEQNVVFWNESQNETEFTSLSGVNYTFSVENIGNDIKDYTVEIVAPEGLNYTLNESAFSLGVNDSKNVSFTLTPTNETNFTATVKLISNGNEIFEKNVTLTYVESSTGLTGMFISSVNGAYTPGLIILSLIGLGALAYIVYLAINKYVWTEKVVSYNKNHPQQLTGYMRRY